MRASKPRSRSAHEMLLIVSALARIASNACVVALAHEPLRDLDPRPGEGLCQLRPEIDARRSLCRWRLGRHGLRGGRFDRRSHRFGLRLPLACEARLEALDRIEHHARVGVAVALGVFGQEPAPARRLHERFMDGVVVPVGRQRRAGVDRRQGEGFVGH